VQVRRFAKVIILFYVILWLGVEFNLHGLMSLISALYKEKYGEWVPVLEGPDGVEICHYHLDQAALDAYLLNFR
jgi:hypothetical protein